jgi:hypothetical protein
MQVFDKCILGVLAPSTRIYCTNQLQFAPAADLILFLEVSW